jgi:Outer membrane protein beta-barrel domain
MDKDLHNIEDLFKSALNDHEEMPPGKVWDAVDQRLDKDTVATIKKKYKTLKRFSLLLLLLLIGLSIYELNIRNSGRGIAKTNNTDSDNGMATAKSSDKDIKKNTDRNKITLKKQPDSKDVNNVTTNTIPANSTPEIFIPGNSEPGKSSNNINNSVKKDQKEFSSDIKLSITNPSVSNTYPDIIKTAGEQKIKTSKNTERENIIQNAGAAQVNNLPVFERQFNPLHFEKINRISDDSDNRKITLQSSLSNKNNPPLDVMATTPQPARKNPIKPSRFSISASFSPDIASYRLEDEDTPGQPDNAEDIKRTERHEFSSTTGLFVEYDVNKRWTIQSGITFSNTNIAVEPRDLYAQRVNNGDIKYRLNISSGYAYLVPTFQPVPVLGDTLNVTAITHKLRYLGVPIAVKYSITLGKLKIEALTGVTVNFLTKGKLETEVQKGPNNEIDILNKIEGLKSIYLSGQAGIGAEYKLAGKVSFILMPTARFAFMPINKGSVVKTYPYSFGIAAGLKMRF